MQGKREERLQARVSYAEREDVNEELSPNSRGRLWAEQQGAGRPDVRIDSAVGAPPI